ncbi:MAG: UMP kinase, partial [Desulfobulbaceae bacterium]|nr:UMP kinase [Desulfobulbaceae bacterium]
MQYKRILLKISGEALMGTGSYGISPEMIEFVAHEISLVHESGVQLGLVIGAGNIFRGVSGAAGGMDRTAADNMGMLATVINALALQDALEKNNVPVRVMSALPIHQVCEDYIR